MIYSSGFAHSIFVLLCSTLATLISVLHYNKLIGAHHSTVNRTIDKKPLCMEGVFQRTKNSESSVTGLSFFDLLTDGEDPQQYHRACRLHHYKLDDVVACLDRFGRVRQNQTQLLHFVFVGDSTIREQYDSFRQVFKNKTY